MSALDFARPTAQPLRVGTGRLILRSPEEGDALMLADFGADPAVAWDTESLPHPFGVDEAEICLSRAAAADPAKRVVFVIEHRQFGPIGMLGFHEKTPRRPELSLWLGRPFWNRGYGREAVAAALRWAKAEWGRNVVWAGHFADNPSAGQLLVDAGFLYTGDVEPRTSLARGETVPTRMMVWLA